MDANSWKTGRDGPLFYVDYYLGDEGYTGNEYPSLIIDGVVRTARLSDDRKTLRASISVADVHTLRHVATPKVFLASSRASSNPHPHMQAPRSSTGLMAPDPVSSGRYGVVRQDYDYGDEALTLPGIDARVELRAAVYLPDTETPTPHPVVVFLHGRHHPCLGNTGSTGYSWPCKADEHACPNHEGYDTIALALASQGYAVVSISANGIYPVDANGAIALGSTLRGHLVLAHLELLARANKGEYPQLSQLSGRLDLNNIGLVGHSRGGEGIARAITLNRLLDKGFGLRAALFMGSTAREGIAIPDVHTATVLPFLDGDVLDLTGQGFSDLSRYAFDDDVLHSTVLMLGANHNYFNHVWSPGFQAGADDAVKTWGNIDLPRLDQTQQRLLASFYITGFFRLTLGGELTYLKLFDGSPVTVPGLPEAEVRSAAHFPSSDRYTVQSFETLYAEGASSTSDPWAWTVTEGLGVMCQKSSFNSELRYAHSGYHGFLNLKSEHPLSPAELELRPVDAQRSIDRSSYSHLSFHVAHLLSENTDATVELQVTLNGNRLNLNRQVVDLWPIPEIIPGLGTLLKQQVIVPLSDFSSSPSGPLDALSFTLPCGGSVYLSDIAFVTPSLGRCQSLSLPFVHVEDIHVEPTGMEQVLEIGITLSQATSRKVSLRVYTLIVHTTEGIMRLDASTVFEPGMQSTSVRFVIPAGGFKGEFLDTGRFVSVIEVRALSNALFGRERALLTTPRL
ncbi:hypothetical protein SAMN05216593_10373 [Pseudomonas asturiensis]|uniref:Chlorophyllase enzyme n=1 Tax=Pseudomonas asturiensis TaxID=1190415 RepID=A0A1M7LGF3_9PSED|nr:hypothetical protein [Pseudomonas asturiensis]SHM77231.1 hypothetical protein SAMN05216593_10373 [Pseudomonas asturiensis]